MKPNWILDLKAAANNLSTEDYITLNDLLSSWGASHSYMFDYEQREGTWFVVFEDWNTVSKEKGTALSEDPYVGYKHIHIEGLDEGLPIKISADGVFVLIGDTLLDIHSFPEVIWTCRHRVLRENWVSCIESLMEDYAYEIEENQGLVTTRSIDDEAWIWIPQHPPLKARLLAGYTKPTKAEIKEASLAFFKPKPPTSIT